MLTLPDGTSIRSILLDRDGVINEDDESFIRSPEQVCFIEGSLKTIAAAQRSGLDIAVCTNQSGVARNLLTLQDLYAIHAHINDCIVEAGGKAVPFFFCPHLPDYGCDCRKPAAGMLQLALSATNQLPNEAIFVGDRVSDIEAARNARCRPVLVATGHGATTKAQNKIAGDVLTISRLDDLLNWLD